MIDANLAERLRTIARCVNAKEAYNLRGDTHAQGMMDYLNTNMNRVTVYKCPFKE